MPDALPALQTRDKEAMAIFYKNMMWSGGVGVLPFPIFDLLAITGVQVKMIKELADFYGVEFRKDLAKSIVMGLVGSLSGGVLAGIGAAVSMKFVPVVGNLLAFVALPTASAGITYAVGKVFIQHFEAGGTMLDLEPAKVKEYFRQQFEEGRKEGEKTSAAAPVTNKKS